MVKKKLKHNGKRCPVTLKWEEGGPKEAGHRLYKHAEHSCVWHKAFLLFSDLDQ